MFVLALYEWQLGKVKKSPFNQINKIKRKATKRKATKIKSTKWNGWKFISNACKHHTK